MAETGIDHAPWHSALSSQMIALAIALLAAAGLVVLARLEGSLPAEDTQHGPTPDRGTGPGNPHGSVQHEVLRFAGSLTAVVAGAALAAALSEVMRLQLGFVAVALVLCVVTAVALLGAELGVVRKYARHSHRVRQLPLRALLHLSSLVRGVGRLGARLASFAQVGNEASSRDASEQFSRVLSVEAEMSADEEKLLRGAISLPRTTVRDVMVPRIAVVGVETGTPWSEVLDRVRSSEHSRLPAYRSSLDDVTGVLVAKDLLPFALAESPPSGGWEKLARPAAFVPATKPVADQLREFRNSRTHMAIVVDEYGGTAGILTIEDVLEELVGEIRDEHDVEEPLVRSEDGIRYWVSGRLTIDELEEILDEDLEHGLATTIGGLIFERVGRVPRVGEELRWGNFRVVVEKLKRHAPERVYIERLNATVESQ